MDIKIEINCDNASFGDTHEEALREVARLIKSHIAGKSDRWIIYNRESRILDANGNTVGKFFIENI